jgi:propanol-preferring alcohol dehydrogenase
MTSWQSEPEIVDVPVPTPGPGEVLVKVAGAGVCHSDLHVMEWPGDALPYPLPFTLGHEGAGHVARGAGVRGLDEGEAVIVYGPWGCGRCHHCAQGMENYCVRAGEIGAAVGGLGRDGAMAEYMLVPESRWLVSLGDLDPRTAAPLTDAGLTPYHAIKGSLPWLVPGSTAVVIGIGGLGHVAVQILRAMSTATVVAVDLDPAKLDLAREVGAHHAVPSDDSAAAAIRDLTGGRGATLVVDCVGAQPTLDLAAAAVAVDGAVTIVGLAGGALPVAFGRIPFEVPVKIPYWGSRSELMEVLDLARGGRLSLHVEQHPMDDALEVYERLREGAVDGRAVLVPEAA